RHGDKLARSVEAHGFVPQRSKVNQVAAGTAPEIQDRIGRLTLYRIEQGRVILADIVVSRTVPEGSCEPIVIRNRRLAEAPVSLRHRLRAADARKNTRAGPPIVRVRWPRPPTSSARKTSPLLHRCFFRSLSFPAST